MLSNAVWCWKCKCLYICSAAYIDLFWHWHWTFFWFPLFFVGFIPRLMGFIMLEEIESQVVYKGNIIYIYSHLLIYLRWGESSPWYVCISVCLKLGALEYLENLATLSLYYVLVVLIFWFVAFFNNKTKQNQGLV